MIFQRFPGSNQPPKPNLAWTESGNFEIGLDLNPIDRPKKS